MAPRRRYRPLMLWLELERGSGHDYFPCQVHEHRALVLELMGGWEGAEDVRRQCLAMARREGAAGTVVRTLLQLSKLLQRRGRYGEARDHFQEARDKAGRSGDQQQYGQALAGLGVVLWRLGDCDGAEALYQQALEIYREIEYSEGLSNVYNNMGVIHEGRGEYDKAMACYRAKRAIDEAAGNRQGLGTVLNNMGVCLMHQDDMVQAQEMFREKLGLEQAIGNKAGVATALTNLGIVLRNRGEHSRALECCQRSLEIYRELGDQRSGGLATNNLGNIHKQMGQPGQALDCYRAALAVAEAQGDRKDIAIYSGNIGQLYHHWLPDTDLALKCYSRAINILQEMNQPFHLCEYLLFRGQLLLKAGKVAGLDAEAQRVTELAERAGRADILFQARIFQARLGAMSDKAAAIQRLESLAEQGAGPLLQAEALFWLGMISGQEGHRAMALEALRKIEQNEDDPELRQKIQQLEGLVPDPEAIRGGPGRTSGG